MILKEILFHCLVGEKLMLKSKFWLNSKLWILFKDFFQEIPHFFVYFLALFSLKKQPNKFMIEKVLTLNSKRQFPNNQLIGDNSQRVHITSLSIFFIFIMFHNFWSHIAHCPTLIIEIITISSCSQAKISENPSAVIFPVNNVLRFDISMHNILLIQVTKGSQQVPDNILNKFSSMQTLFPQSFLQSPSRQVLSNHIHQRFGFINPIEVEDIRVIKILQDLNFVLQGLIPFQLNLLPLPRKYFCCFFHPRELVLDHVYRCKCPSPQSFQRLEVLGETLVGELPGKFFIQMLKVLTLPNNPAAGIVLPDNQLGKGPSLKGWSQQAGFVKLISLGVSHLHNSLFKNFHTDSYTIFLQQKLPYEVSLPLSCRVSEIFLECLHVFLKLVYKINFVLFRQQQQLNLSHKFYFKTYLLKKCLSDFGGAVRFQVRLAAFVRGGLLEMGSRKYFWMPKKSYQKKVLQKIINNSDNQEKKITYIIRYIFMSALGIWNNRYEGGECYAACMETFAFYNPSIAICWKGCDYGTGRVNDPKGREEAQRMCKRFTTESMWTRTGELEEIEDLRVHGQMFPTQPKNIYRACLAGIRRQKY